MTQPTEPVEVTQADVNAAIRSMNVPGFTMHYIPEHRAAQLAHSAREFAAHRVAAERAALLLAANEARRGDHGHDPSDRIAAAIRALIPAVPDPQTGEK